MLPKINPLVEVRRLIAFIKHTVRERSFANVVIAVSGGVDSTTTLILAVKAIGRGHVYPLLLPYKSLNSQGTDDALLIIRKLKIPHQQIEVVNIGTSIDALVEALSLKQDIAEGQVRVGNILARIRMVVLYDRAKKHRALVLGTENKSEHYLSYFTRFGDEASDVEPIRHLYKTQVYELARYLNVPEVILTKAPTAGLWTGQTDEGQFGFSYRDADQILYGLYESGLAETELIKNGLLPDIIRRVKEWVEKNQFKHELPIIYKPTAKK